MTLSIPLVTLCGMLAFGLGGSLHASGENEGSAFQLLEEGKSAAVIVLAADSSTQIKTAAAFLQKTLKRCTGVELPIVEEARGRPALHVGQTAYTREHPVDLSGLDEEGFVLEGRAGDQFLIMGASDWGTEFAVYDFLERYLGVRWLMPGQAGAVLPQHTSLVIPAKRVRESPVYMLSRTISGARTETDEVEWSQLNRIRFHRLARAHNLNRLFPPSRFGESNPEFYPILGGSRFIPPNDANYQWQPNFSEPGLVDAAVEEIDRYFCENPEAVSYSLATNDTGLFDESPASLARRSGGRNMLNFLDVSDDYFPWANAVVEKVLERHPDKWFGAQAYRETLAPPTRISQLNARFVPHLTYERLKWMDPKLKEADQELTLRWAAVAPNLGWYDYTYGLSYQVPRVWFHLMQEYLAWGADHHVRSFHGDYLPNWTGEGPKTWVLCKLLWNPHQDVDALLDDWYGNAVGKAAAPLLKRHFALWETFWTDTVLKSDWYQMEGGDGALYMRFSDPGYLPVVPPALLEESNRLMERVIALAETPDQKTRAGRMHKMWRFYYASASAYQAEYKGLLGPPASEADALARLDEAAPALRLTEERMRLLSSFTMEDGAFIPHFYSRAQLIGAYWGRSLFWSVRPWMKQSETLRRRVATLAERPETPEGALALRLLAVEDGGFSEQLRNAGFTGGLRHWGIKIHPTSGGTIRVVKDVGSDGGNVVIAKGVARGMFQQSVPVKAGAYLVGFKVRLKKKAAPGARVQLRLFPNGMSWRNGSYHFIARGMPACDVPLKAGEWVGVQIPFEVPNRKNLKELTLNIDITGLTDDSEVMMENFTFARMNPINTTKTR